MKTLTVESLGLEYSDGADTTRFVQIFATLVRADNGQCHPYLLSTLQDVSTIESAGERGERTLNYSWYTNADAFKIRFQVVFLSNRNWIKGLAKTNYDFQYVTTAKQIENKSKIIEILDSSNKYTYVLKYKIEDYAGLAHTAEQYHKDFKSSSLTPKVSWNAIQNKTDVTMGLPARNLDNWKYAAGTRAIAADFDHGRYGLPRKSFGHVALPSGTEPDQDFEAYRRRPDPDSGCESHIDHAA